MLSFSSRSRIYTKRSSLLSVSRLLLNISQSNQAPAPGLSQLLQAVTQSVEAGRKQACAQNHIQSIPQQTQEAGRKQACAQNRIQNISQQTQALGLTQSIEVSQVNQPVVVENVSRTSMIPKTPLYQYKVRIINPNKKSEVKVCLIHDVTSKFASIGALKGVLMSQFKDLVPAGGEFDVGFMEGSQQAKIWLANQKDLLSMYKTYSNGGNVTLWCDSILPDSGLPSNSGKRKRDGETSTTRQEKEEDIDNIFQELREKHSEMEFAKLRMWARMISGKLYDNYDEPPEGPLFYQCERKRPRKDTDALSGAATATCKVLSPSSTARSNGSELQESASTSFSPSKQVNLRMKNYEQLRYLKTLYEDGILEVEIVNKKKIY